MNTPRRSSTSSVRDARSSLDLQRRIEAMLAQLTQIRSAVVVAAAALRQQNCELDADVARVLQRSVAAGIGQHIEQLRRLGARRGSTRL